MRFLKQGSGRWAVPAVLAGLLAAALLVTPVIAGSSGVTAKKVNKTIAKKTNITALAIPGAPNLSTSQTILGTLSLSQGSYLVTTTFDVRQNAAGANIQCVLRVNGVGQDQSDTFVGTGTISDQSSVAMQVAGQAKAATTAQLLCSSTQAANINHAEIIALKVPGVKFAK
jgi:Tfp pilus assembly major pilin PilA